MDLALQKRRLVIAMSVSAVSLIAAVAAIVAMFSFHVGWAIYPFVAAILVGFASHGWLMLGVLRDKAPS